MNEIRVAVVGRGGFSLVVVLPLLLGAALPVERTASSGAEEASRKKTIRQVLDDQVAAWNKGDLDGFMAGYWNAENLTFFSGKDQTKGWKATLERYRKRYQADGKEMGKLAFRDLQIEVLGPDSAFVRGRWQLEMKKERLGGLFTLIVKKMPEGWRIVHDHTSGG